MKQEAPNFFALMLCSSFASANDVKCRAINVGEVWTSLEDQLLAVGGKARAKLIEEFICSNCGARLDDALVPR